jgi:hypothetical protein
MASALQSLGFPNRSWLGEVIVAIDCERQSTSLGTEHLKEALSLLTLKKGLLCLNPLLCFISHQMLYSKNLIFCDPKVTEPNQEPQSSGCLS